MRAAELKKEDVRACLSGDLPNNFLEIFVLN